MAQLYKMTLYVCDLEDSLSLDEIETLIKQDALDGISVNCVCHFADSKIGQNVEWNDDIDLNRCDCHTSAWEKYFAPPTKEKTNAEPQPDDIQVRTVDDLGRICIPKDIRDKLGIKPGTECAVYATDELTSDETIVIRRKKDEETPQR